jgi:hypothetical protein
MKLFRVFAWPEGFFNRYSKFLYQLPVKIT